MITLWSIYLSYVLVDLLLLFASYSHLITWHQWLVLQNTGYVCSAGHKIFWSFRPSVSYKHPAIHEKLALSLNVIKTPKYHLVRGKGEIQNMSYTSTLICDLAHQVSNWQSYRCGRGLHHKILLLWAIKCCAQTKKVSHTSTLIDEY